MGWLNRLLGRERVGDWEPSPARAPTASQRYRFSDTSVRIAAIGDLHGRIDLVHQLAPQLDQLAQDPDRRLIEVYLGDYIDRGPRSNAIIEYLMQRSQLTDRTVICLLGNHEQALLAGLESDRGFERWIEFGGRPTIASYGVALSPSIEGTKRVREAFASSFPAEHADFLKSLRLHYSHAEFLFVHAGLRPGVPLAEQKVNDLLWIRDSFLRSHANFGAIVVHGHSPTVHPEFRPNRIGIDTGAYYSSTLTCLLVTSGEVSVLQTGASAVQAKTELRASS